MKFRTSIFVLLFISPHAPAAAQDSKFFREKLGKAAEIYLHRSGISVRVDYDDEGQACGIVISEPSHQKRGNFHRLMAVAEELIPSETRGAFIGRTGTTGNCTKIEIMDYERVRIVMNEDACYEQWIRILVKRSSCPELPTVPGLDTPYKRMEDMDAEARRKFLAENHLLSVPAPDWSLQDLDGRPVSLSDFSNKLLVLSFVSAGGNVQEPTLKFLQTQYEKYKGKGIAFVCIDLAEKPDRQNIKINLERMGVTIPTLTDGSEVARRYNTIQPLIVLIDEKGVIRFKNSIWHDYRPFVTEQIEFLIESKKK